MRTLILILATVLSVPALFAQTRPAGTLDMYLIDTEGGHATLYVTPTDQSLLMDAGNPGTRDVDRIVATLAAAGIAQLDYLLLTHYHVDHVGGTTELAKRIPIRNFVDHGPSVEPNEQVAGFQAAYAALHANATRIIVKPGDRLPITGVDWRIVTSGGDALQTPLPGGGQQNTLCSGFTRMEALRDLENAESVGSVVTYGEFRTIDLGDLLWNVEFDLMCPVNRVGPIDLYVTSHHGLASSGSPTLVHALRPRVAIMNNGTRKGGAIQTFQTLRASPGLEDLWQLHWSYNGGVEHNSAGVFIANIDEPAALASVISPPPAAPATTPGATPAPGGQGGGAAGAARTVPHTGPAAWIKVSAQADGTFTVTNSRNGFSRTYTK